MRDSIKKCYDAALKDEEFQTTAVIASRGNKKPGFFADELSRLLYALMYYGYVIGKYGPEYAKKNYPSESGD